MREVAPVAGGVQRRGGFGDVLAHDRHVADLPVALAEIEVGEADGARVVRDLGLLQGAVVQRDGARLFAARKGDAAVQPPEIRVQDRRQRCRASVSGERPSTVPACARSPCKRYDSASMTRTLSSSSLVSDEGVRSSGASSSMVVGGLPALERRAGPGDHRLQRGVGHGASIPTGYQYPAVIILSAIWS